MGQKLVKYYQFVREKAGQDGVMRLAMKTRVASVIAEKTPDDPETLQRFQKAVKEITGQNFEAK